PAEAGSAGMRRPGAERDTSRWEVPPAPVAPEARRRWALARMDEMVAEQRRCRERFRRPADISECEARYARRHRVFNEIYLEALPGGAGRGRGRVSRRAPTRVRSGGEVDQHLHARAPGEGFLHARLERLQRDLPAHERGQRHGAARAETDRLLPV